MLIHNRCLLFLLCTFSIFSLAACNSIYHRAGSDLSIGLGPLLSSRLTDARNDATAAAVAISHCTDPASAEPMSWDFSKSVGSVHDVAERLNADADDPIHNVIAALDRADADLAAAIDPAHPEPRPTLSQASTSLKLAIARADAYLSDRTALLGPTSTNTSSLAARP